MSELQLLWFVLIGVLFAGFFFLEGYDFGVGMQFITNAHTKEEREQLYSSIGPNWDANEVWLLTAGGAMFASFPFWYASLFSGFYIMLFIVLIALIFRAASFEFRDQVQKYVSQRAWERTIGISSFVAPFFLGMIFTAMVKGMPIDAHGDIYGGFFDYVNIYSLVGGVAVALMSYIHGLNFTKLKVEGRLYDVATKQLKFAYPLLIAGEALFAVLTFFMTDLFQNNPVWEFIICPVIVVTTLLSWFASAKGKEGFAFVTSGLILAELVAFLFAGLFPRVMVGNNPKFSILIENASSSTYTLQVMSIVVLIALPITLAYQIWSFVVFARRFKSSK
ncbi:MAG: cytochrome d ubiquinol oxidase subunit II [Lactobacillaceae bacterium]|jgi:cytochrome d ubiquinol oxidase subunit II|nr:cytochrome d ubiquinol oxidase subunit II [Lactobacillaceae bacterium]